MSSTAVRTASALAAAGAVHAAVNARLLRRPPVVAAPLDPDSVAVLVPARDEGAAIGDCIAAIAHPVTVLDDESSDDTASRAAAAGARVVPGTPPPPGWLGKPWACAQLAATTTADLLVFVDADVRLGPGAVDRAVALLDAHALDIVCPFPKQLAVTPVERLVQPLLQWSWLTTLPLRIAERSPRPSLTAACGQFVVVRRSALERAGGFAAVRGEVLDDVALVRAVKATGGRGGVVAGHELATCRMYDGWTPLRDGYAKSLWSAFGGEAGAITTAAGLLAVWTLPALAALRGSRAGAVGYAAGVLGRVITARASGGRPLPDALAHPASIAVLAGLSVRSAVLHRRGVLRWKSRPVVA
ncbi:glycosyltransferase family 2 protein [Jatrophihabitans fulvus]